jgi:hypothetical protein
MLLVFPAAGGALLGLGLMAVVDAGNASTSRSSHLSRTRFAPIPIPHRACAYLEAVHDTSEPVGNASWRFIVGSEAERLRAANGFSAKLGAFDLALRVAATQVPDAVRYELMKVAQSVERGQALLRTTPNAQAFVDRGFGPLADGVLALNDASDLVGAACGFRLSAVAVR